MVDKNKSNGKCGLIIFSIVLLVFLIAIILLGSLLYVTKYKIETVDMQQSPDGAYELMLQAVGNPYFPFGDAPGRLVLKENETVISRTRFEIANDGARFTENAWNVTWCDDYVEIILSGPEQYDELFRLYYDGKLIHNYGPGTCILPGL